MRVLHVALLPTFEPGIQQQMVWEQSAATAEGLDWTVRMFTPFAMEGGRELIVGPQSFGERRGPQKVALWVRYRRMFHAWLLNQAMSYDVVMLRHSPFDPFRSSLLAAIPAAVATVHHSLELAELQQIGGIGGIGRAALERYFGRRALAGADAIVGVTPEICRYEEARVESVVPTVVYPNGILFDRDLVDLADDRGDLPEILFVASEFAPWHGLDLLLEAFANYSSPMKLHLVGRVPEPLRAVAARNPRVELHGVLGPDQMSRLLSRAWIGLSSFALNRLGMRQACTLKVRQYLRAGVPVYAGHEDVFGHSPFYRVGKPDPNAILEFASEARALSRVEVACAARPHIDKRVLVSQCFTDVVKAVQ